MTMTGTKRLIVIATAGYCIALYPAVLRTTQATGYDAPIYWRAARGDLSPAPPHANGLQQGWVYSERLLPLLRPVALTSYPTFLFILHLANSLGTAALMAAALRRTNEYPVLAGAAAFLVGSKASDIVAGGNITGLLCGMALTPWGALVAAAVKPYFVMAVVFHAAAWCAARAGRRAGVGCTV